MPKRGKKEEEEKEEEPDDAEVEEEVEEEEEKPKKGKKGKKAKKTKDDSEEDEEDEEDDDLEDASKSKNKKKKAVTVTLTRVDGSLGIAMAGNLVTEVKKGGAGEKAGLLVGDHINEVQGKDTGLASFGSLLPKDKELPIKMRLTRFVEV